MNIMLKLKSRISNYADPWSLILSLSLIKDSWTLYLKTRTFFSLEKNITLVLLSSIFMALMRFNFVSVLSYLLGDSMVGLPVTGSALIHKSNIQRNKQKNVAKLKKCSILLQQKNWSNDKNKNFFVQTRHYHNLIYHNLI